MRSVVTWLVGCSLFLGAVALSAADRPNVLFITVDDMNRDSIGVYGCPIPDITPNIDKLATEGLRFEHAHVTIAICMPTRAVWMTGRYPHRSGALGFDRINKDVATLLETLHDAGYHTGIMAKVPHVVPSRGKAWDVVVEANDLGVGRDPAKYYQQSKKFFAEVAKSDKPFFLMVNSQDPHRPFANSQQEQGRLKGKRKDPKFYTEVSRTFDPQEVPVPGFLPDLPEIRQELSEYYASVHRADEIVGSLLKALDESGLARNTLVVFTSDHGMPLPFAKTNCWRHSTITPWIVRWPGVVKPDSIDREHMISGIDYTPTILDAVGLSPLPGVDGRSYLPILKGKSQRNRNYVITSINRTSGKNEYPMRCVMTRNASYIFNGWSNGQKVFKNESQAGLTMKAMKEAAKTDTEIAARVKHFLYRTPEELYDNDSDPDALHNWAKLSECQGVLNGWRNLLLKQMIETDDPVLPAYKTYLESVHK
ncbi:sulfatase [Planctomycetaceae bacterium]|nr:sulfatase [Planctomycetaceae bacterium]